MKTIKSICAIACAMYALTASAESDSIYVRMDFNENPWGMATCPYFTKDNGKKSWGQPSYEPEEARLATTTVFELPACGDKVTMTVTPSDLDETDYDNALVRDENYDNSETETFLYMYIGSTMTFKAPKGYRMAKVAFNTYRSWASGGLYTGEATGGLHVWGPDSTKIRTYELGGVQYSYDCWSGDAYEWSLPAVTSATRLRYIDFWFLPADENAVSFVTEQKKKVNVVRPDGMVVRRGMRLEDAIANLPKGIYIIDDKKYIIK